MKKLSITVVHRLPNRVRIKLSEHIKDYKNFYEILKKNLSKLTFKYNIRKKSLTLEFESNEILLQEMIYRVGVAFSIENGLMPVKLVEECEYKTISPISIYAVTSIAASGLNKIVNPKDYKLQNYMNVFSMGITSVSVIEHAYRDIKSKGIIDIEILPVLYLAKSFIEEIKLSTVLIMWLTTFGRHLTIPKSTSKLLDVARTKSKNGYDYKLSVREDYSIENLSDFVYNIFFRQTQSYYNNINEKYIF